MSASEANTFMLFHDFEDNEEGKKLTEWPTHIPITPFFHLDEASYDDVSAIVTAISKHSDPVQIKFYEHSTKIDDFNDELQELHTLFIRGLGEVGCKFFNLKHSLKKYSPHLSHATRFQLPLSPYEVESISVVSKVPKVDSVNKLIIQKFPLGM